MTTLTIAALSVISIVFGLISIALNNSYNEELGEIAETIGLVSFFSLLIYISFVLSTILGINTIENIAFTFIKVIASITFGGLIIRTLIVTGSHLTAAYKENNDAAERARKYRLSKKH